jgi:recombination protein RecA
MAAKKEVEKIVGIDLETFKKQWKDKVKDGVSFKDDELQHISTGSVKLDWALKRPLLEGSMVEIYGPNAVGKTSLALQICSNAMKMGKMCFYIDLEFKLREVQLNMTENFDKSKFTIVYPDNGEEALNIMHDIIVNYPGCVIILDSVGGILPEVEDAEDFNKQGMASVAKLLHKMIRKVSAINAKNKCVLIFLNHLTSTLTMYGSPNTTHGGTAIKNRASQRIELKALASGAIKIGDEQIGQMVRATVVKNNVNRPYVTIEFPIMYGKGIDWALDMFQFAKDLGIIQGGGKGGWYQIPVIESIADKSFHQEDVIDMLRKDEVFKKQLYDKIQEMVA